MQHVTCTRSGGLDTEGVKRVGDELAAMIDGSTGSVGVIFRAALLVAAVPDQALTRRDGGPQDRVKVSRSQLRRLIRAIDEAHPGLRERCAAVAKIDAANVE